MRKFLLLEEIAERRTWRQIAEYDGLNPNETDIRTLQKRLDKYAALIWEECDQAGIWPPDGGDSYERLKKSLEEMKFRAWLFDRVGLPFDLVSPPNLAEQCKQIVLALACRGAKVLKLSHRWITRDADQQES
jgi:hypothetical protein